jgi:hypothetical protein
MRELFGQAVPAATSPTRGTTELLEEARRYINK